jgi:hypothetical protein
LNLNPENKRKENDSARLKIPPLKYESGIFIFNTQLLLSGLIIKNAIYIIF